MNEPPLWKKWARRGVRGLLRLLFRVEVRGLEHMDKASGRLVIIANHQSFLDVPLIYSFLPGRHVYAYNQVTADLWWVQAGRKLAAATVYLVDTRNPFGIRQFIKYLRDHPEELPVIFPEGRLTTTGSLMKIYEGPGMVADKIGARLLPVQISGSKFSKVSLLGGRIKTRWFPKITLDVHPPVALEPPEDSVGRRRRQTLWRQLQRTMVESAFYSRDIHRLLTEALDETARHYGSQRVFLIDTRTEKKRTYRQFKAAVRTLGRFLAKRYPDDERIGILLPTVPEAMILFFALLCEGKTPVMLNVTTGRQNLLQSLDTAEIRRVITAREFVEKSRYGDTIEAISEKADLLYLEDLAGEILIWRRLQGWLLSWLPYPRRQAPDDAAVVLFTSGTTGAPKGVVLTHENILANACQIESMLDLNPADRVLNAMPVFHSLGLVAGTLIPMLLGARVCLYPTPLHYRMVPEMAYISQATVVLGTDTFLSFYARVANPYNFFSTRYVFAGGEKLKESTRQQWMDTFGIRILEGYGITETSPILAGNTPFRNRSGTVGQMMPGIEYRLEPVEGLKNGGRLFVRGPNVMKGYLLADRPGEIQPPKDGWFDTGDIVSVDDEGFVRIEGRAKRFAKVGGEMVPLDAVEEFVRQVWARADHAVLSGLEDEGGEALVLVTEKDDPQRRELTRKAQEKGFPELWVPKKVVHHDKLPRLGTGKVDYQKVRETIDS